MTSQIERASQALHEANRHGRIAAPLIPAMAGCPECLTMRMIASPGPLGSCPVCGTKLEVLPGWRVDALSAPLEAA